MAPLSIGQSQQNRVICGLALLGAVEIVEPRIQLLPPFGQAKRRLVRDVIATPHERVHRTQSLALAAGQDEERVIKVLGRSPRNAFADGICHDELRRCRRPWHRNLLRAHAHRDAPRDTPKHFAMAARVTKPSLRDFEIAGRFPSTAYPCCSMAFKISRPPRLKRSRSMARSRSTLAINGSPCRNHSR